MPFGQSYGAYKMTKKLGTLFAKFAGASDERAKEIGDGLGLLCSAVVATGTLDLPVAAAIVADQMDGEKKKEKNSRKPKP